MPTTFELALDPEYHLKWHKRDKCHCDEYCIFVDAYWKYSVLRELAYINKYGKFYGKFRLNWTSNVLPELISKTAWIRDTASVDPDDYIDFDAINDDVFKV